MNSISSVATSMDLIFKSARPTSSPLLHMSTYAAQSDYLRNYDNINASSSSSNSNNNNNEAQQYINMSNIVFDAYAIGGKSYNLNLKFTPTVTIIIAIVAGLMSLITIIGNVFVITAFIIDKSLRSYSNYFILNLSIADLLIGLLIPPYAPFLLLNYQWKLGRAACTIWLVLDYVVGSASVLCIVVISLDRYLLVSRGLDYVSSQRVYKAIIIMLTVWLIAFLNYAPAIVFWEIIAGKPTNNNDDESCKVAFHDSLVYLTATACVEFFAPLISICVLNLAVYLNIRKRSRGLIRSENPKFTLKASTSTGEACMSTKSTTFAGTSKATMTITSTAGEATVSKCSSKNRRPPPPSPKKPLCASTSSTCSSSSTDEAVAASNHAAAKTSIQHSNKKRSTSNNSKTSSQPPIVAAATEEIILLDECKKDGSTIRNISVKKTRTAKVEKLKSKGKLFSQTSLVELNNMSTKEVCLKNKVGTTHNGGGSGSGSGSGGRGGRGGVRSNRKQVQKKNVTMTKKSNTARGNLSKDKKAARSLFILVFVFVFCWVNKYFKNID
jgi:hypothetical protein